MRRIFKRRHDVLDSGRCYQAVETSVLTCYTCDDGVKVFHILHVYAAVVDAAFEVLAGACFCCFIEVGSGFGEAIKTVDCTVRQKTGLQDAQGTDRVLLLRPKLQPASVRDHARRL